MFVTYGIWCLADVSSVSLSSEQSHIQRTRPRRMPAVIGPKHGNFFDLAFVSFFLFSSFFRINLCLDKGQG